MSEALQNAETFAGNHRLRRGVSLLPGLFTVGNLSLGFFAILSALIGTPPAFDAAARAIGFAILFDMFDGRIARATGTTTEFGKQFDSLADVISFGVAPSVLAFAWGIRSFYATEPGLNRNIYWLGAIVCAVFVTSCAWRLARFNIQGMAPGTESRFFVGMPTPAAAGMIAASVHALKEPVRDWRFALGWMIIVAGLAALMASTIRYYGFKDISLRQRRTSLVVVFLVLLFWFIAAFSEYVLLVLASLYMLSGLVVQLLRVAHKPKPAP
jgi:CDP-diacylglycerol--serine O-phosphatidyltransferase